MEIENGDIQFETDDAPAYMTLWTIVISVLIGLGAGYAFGETKATTALNDRGSVGAPTPAPEQAPPTPAAAMQKSGGSLFKASLHREPDPNRVKLAQVSFFAVPEPEPRTIKKHDLVTVIVREESSFSSDGMTEAKRESDFEAKIEQFISLNGGNLGTAFNTGTVPEIKMNGTRNFKGEGTVDRTDSLTFRITAEVIDVKPNGTLVLQAKQRIKTDDEEQTYVFTGTGRVEDVTPDNTILSTQLFDKDVAKTHTGAVRDATKRGWLTRLLDFVNPL